MEVTILLFSFLAMGFAQREFNCTVDEKFCTGSGMQSIVVSGLRMCCPSSATFNLNNNLCKCVEPANAEEPCLEGLVQCRQATSFNTDSQGNVRCCMPGYALNSITNSYINGVLVDICTCTPFGSGGIMSTLIGLGNGGGRFPRVQNATDIFNSWRKFGDQWRSWGQDFARGFSSWGREFGESMRGVGRDIARGMRSSVLPALRDVSTPIQKALNNAFRTFPRFF